MIVLVSGGRSFGLVPKDCPARFIEEYAKRATAERLCLRQTLDRIHAEREISLLIQGGANGADSFAEHWARNRKVSYRTFPVTSEEWRRLGLRAGPMRNGRMLLEGRPDLGVFFPGGPGTADMLAQARNAELEILEIEVDYGADPA